MRQHAPGVLREEQQQLELLRRQPQLVAAPRHPAAIEIDDEIAAADHARTATPSVRRSATRTRASSSSAPKGLVT